MNEFTTSSFQRLYKAAHKVLKEDADTARQQTAERVYQKMIDDEALKILAELSIIINGSGSPVEKLQAVCDLLIDYENSDDDDNAPTKVSTSPRLRD